MVISSSGVVTRTGIGSSIRKREALCEQQVSDEARLQRVADRYASKYDWHYAVHDGAFYLEENWAEVYEVAPTTAFDFSKGDPFSQTRWRF